jgi:hypothetical protein
MTSRCKTAAGWFSLVVGEEHHNTISMKLKLKHTGSLSTEAQHLYFDQTLHL